MIYNLETDIINIELNTDTAALNINFLQNKALSLTAKDKLNGDAWFSEAYNYTCFETNGLSCARFNVMANAGQEKLTAEYTLCVSKDIAAVLVLTRLKTNAAVKAELPLDWLTFKTDGVQALHSLTPMWNKPTSELQIPTSFKKEMILEYINGCVGFFHSGEPVFDPKKLTARPDMWVETSGISCYQPLHTAVIAYGESAEQINAMSNAADILYNKADKLLQTNAPEFCGEAYKFESGCLNFTVTKSNNGVALTEINSLESLKNIAMPLAELSLRSLLTGKEFYIDTLSGWSSCAVCPENSGARVILSGIENFPELSLEIEIKLCPQKNAVEWTTHVLNCEQQLSILSASYPPSAWSAKNASCFIPEHCGWVAENVTDIHFYRDGIYPRGWRFTMGYFAVYTPQKDKSNGFYCGIHDPDGTFRTMNIESDPIEKTGLFYARAHAVGTGKGANAFTVPGKLVWQMFNGDWYDATLIYKDFVHSEASWLPEVGSEGREDTPLWAKELPFWVMDWMPNTNPLAEPIPTSLNKTGKAPSTEYWYEEPLKLQRELGVPIGYHVYNWHWIPFNNDYPYYLPAKKEFEDNIYKLQNNNVRIMPYINARLWDTHDCKGEDWQFSKTARQWATKDADGKLFIEKYESHEPDGSLCELAPMCPSSGVWKKQIANILKAMFNDIKVDGMYLDQIAAAAPYLCEDLTHNHLPGGGSWWTEQYNLMMRRNRQICTSHNILTTEDNAEVYAKAMDSFLSWIWTFDNLVPAFSVIYSGYIIMFGRNTNGLKKGDEIFLKYQTAEQLVFGGQLGWTNADIVQRPRELEFIKKMANLRYKYSPFFYKGEALRPAILTSDRPIQLTTSAYYDTRLFEAKQLHTGTWQLWDKTRTVLFIINCDTTIAQFTVKVQSQSAVFLEGNGIISSEQHIDSLLVLTGTVSAEDYIVIELKN